MTVTESLSLLTNRSPGTAAPVNKQCIFRSDETWFSLPATSVREITIAPARVKVPLCHRALLGLSHLRSVFLPVVSLNDLLDLQHDASARHQLGASARHQLGASAQSHQQLLVLQAASPWALLIAEAVALEALETILTPEGSWEESNPSPVMGTAMYRDQIVQVLDPNRLLQFAQQVFDDLWYSCSPDQPFPQPALRGAR
jgi:chemotaxis signal transduction protein